MKKTIWLLIAFVLTISNYVGAQTNKNRGWEIKKILETMSNKSASIYPVIAHRGYWRGEKLNGTHSSTIPDAWYPENSYAAVLNCELSNIEAAEIDIRTSKDGIPFLLHDLSFGRTTNQSWNPMTHTGSNTLVNETNWASAPLYLRAWNYVNNTKVIGNTHPSASSSQYGTEPMVVSGLGHKLPKLEDFLNWHKKYDLKVALFLEIQTPRDFEYIYDVVKKTGTFNRVVFKMGIGGGPEEGYYPVLVKKGVFTSKILGGRTYYFPVERSVEEPFCFITIHYEDTKQKVKDWAADMIFQRTDYKSLNVNHIFAELVPKATASETLITRGTYLYSIAKTCYIQNIRVGGYWVIAGAEVTPRGVGTTKVKGYFAKGGVNISNQGELLLTQNGSCCGSAGLNGYQTNLNNILKPFIRPSSTGVEPLVSGMGTGLITSDEVEQLNSDSRLSRSIVFRDSYYKSNTSSRLSNPSLNDLAKLSILNEETIESKTVTVFPNPVQNELKVSFVATNNQEAIISLVNTEGKVLLQQKNKTSFGNNVFTLSTATIKNGTYILRVQTADKIETKQVVVLK